MLHSFSTTQQFPGVHTHQGCRNHPEVGESGIAPANIGTVKKNTSKIIFSRHLHHSGAGIGDSDEGLAWVLASLCELVVPVLVKNQRLGSGAGFRRDDEKTMIDINLVRERDQNV